MVFRQRLLAISVGLVEGGGGCFFGSKIFKVP